MGHGAALTRTTLRLALNPGLRAAPYRCFNASTGRQAANAPVREDSDTTTTRPSRANVSTQDRIGLSESARRKSRVLEDISGPQNIGRRGGTQGHLDKGMATLDAIRGGRAMSNTHLRQDEISDAQNAWQIRKSNPNVYNLDQLHAPVRLDPYVGRSVGIDPKGKVSLTTAFSRLERLAAQNKIRRDQRMQKTHERPGKKRKRLRSERWRARFKVGFTALLRKVTRMQHQGW